MIIVASLCTTQSWSRNTAPLRPECSKQAGSRTVRAVHTGTHISNRALYRATESDRGVRN